ncbi:nucleotide sugar dehydrogenase [Xylariales sp. PMI_506]|nr:nucleotide sugar dehydrogenase [Xylariales sp. PMI_506]
MTPIVGTPIGQDGSQYCTERYGSATRPNQQTSPPDTPPLDSSEDSLVGIETRGLPQFGNVDQEEEPLVAVIGCGYVGSNLIHEFQRHYNVLGFDISTKQIDILKETLGSQHKRASFTLVPEELTPATHFLVSVPTLLLEDKTIDTSYIENALGLISKYGRRGSTVVIESSVAVGMTRTLLGPLAAERGFFAGMSPERVDPGRSEPAMHTIPKVISGLDDVAPGSLDSIARLYSRIFDNVFPVSKPEVAEMMKLYENCQRMMCIAYANEMADACIPHNIDPFEVCRAAATKPFGYMPFSPSLGVGGHCIPVNPYYLLSNSNFPLLKLATENMWRRPVDIGQRILDVIFNDDKSDTKPGQSVLSNSPGLKLVQSLVESGRVDVMYCDPLVHQDAIPHIPRFDDRSWNKDALEMFDMIIVAMKQIGLDIELLQQLNYGKVQVWCA